MTNNPESPESPKGPSEPTGAKKQALLMHVDVMHWQALLDWASIEEIDAREALEQMIEIAVIMRQEMGGNIVKEIREEGYSQADGWYS